MGTRFEKEETTLMKCHVCGSKMKPVVTDLPFKVNNNTIVVIKNLPVLQCEGCTEYLLDDPVMQRVEEIAVQYSFESQRCTSLI